MSRFCVPALKKERQNCWFNQEEITNLIDGSKKKTEFRRIVEKEFFSRPEFLDPIPTDYLSHEDLYTNDLRKSVAFHKLIKTDQRLKKILGDNARRKVEETPVAAGIQHDGDPLGLHFSMFFHTLEGQCNDEQKSYWIPKAEALQITGAYAQTEMGHGTYLKGLETTATYDPSTEEFVLNSPTISSFKFWPGGLGKTATHAAVMAQLYTRGKSYGPHLFIVQLRDTATHRSLPGVIVGDMGPKLGFKSNDNGFLGFKEYRIPRMNMPMKYSQVQKDGTYVWPPNQKLSYGTMVYTRATICFGSMRYLSRAITIAVRYSAVRHQSKILPDEPEPQILDFQTQQYKLIPHIASVFAILFSSRSLIDLYTENSAHVSKGNFNLMPELHALASGLKANTTSDATYGIDTCRLACGGNGFIASSNLPRLFSWSTATITLEGENTVLLFQVARYLMKSQQQKNSNGNRDTVTDHFPKSDLSSQGLLRKWRATVSFLLNGISSEMKKWTSSGMKYELAWNKMGVKLIHLAQMYTRCFMCEQFVKTVDGLSVSPATKTILGQLCRLYLLYHTTLNQGPILRSGSLLADDLPTLENELHELLALLRKDAVNIVDSFDIHDRILNSTLGSWDGNVYERLYNESLRSPMNQKDVVDAIPKYLQPLMKAQL